MGRFGSVPVQMNFSQSSWNLCMILINEDFSLALNWRCKSDSKFKINEFSSRWRKISLTQKVPVKIDFKMYVSKKIIKAKNANALKSLLMSQRKEISKLDKGKFKMIWKTQASITQAQHIKWNKNIHLWGTSNKFKGNLLDTILKKP